MKKNLMCKRLSLLVSVLACMVCACSCAGGTGSAGAGTPGGPLDSADEVIATIAIFSDVHIGKKNTNPESKFQHAMQVLPLVAEGLDAVCFGGDITNLGTDKEYTEFMRILNENINPDIKRVICMGNHEYFRDGVVRYGGESEKFIEECQTAYKSIVGGELDTHTVVNGVHIIAVSPRNSAADYKDCEEFIIKNVEAAAKENSDMPIIIISHEGAGSFFEGGCQGYTQKTIDCLQKYPQIIFFSGHNHCAAQDMRMIQQDKYTTFQTSTLGADFWNYSFEKESQPKKAREASQGFILNVKKNGTSEVTRYDFTNNQNIGQIIKIDPKNFIYTDSYRNENAEKPVFDSEDVIVAEQTGENKIKLTFPTAKVNDKVSDGVIYSFKIRIYDENQKAVHIGTMMSEYFLGAAAHSEYSYIVKDLAPGKYSASVTAASVFNKHSEPLKVNFIIQ